VHKKLLLCYIAAIMLHFYCKTVNLLPFSMTDWRRQTAEPSYSRFKSRMQCSSMQVVMNKCFLLNPEKNLIQIYLVVFENNKKRTL